jgi:hypothetical protein
MQHIAHPDQDDDGRELRIARQHALEDQIERFRSDTRTSDAADVDPPGTESQQGIGSLEDPLKRPGPRRVLIEEKTLRLTSTTDENAIKTGGLSGNFVAPFTLTVDVELHVSLQFGEDLGVDFQMLPEAGRKDEILAFPPNPSSSH